MVDPTDATGTRRHAAKYVAVGGFLLTVLVVAVALSRLGLDGGALVVSLLVVVGLLLRYAFLPLFRRLHDDANAE